MSNPDALRAIAWSYRSEMAANVLYALAIGQGLAGFVLAAYGHTLPAVILGCTAFIAACLCAAAFRSARRWRAYADSLDEVA